MKQYLHFLLCALLSAGAVSFSGLAQADATETASLVEPLVLVEQEPLSAGRYVAGGLVGSTLGFGIGHAIVGEYRNMGMLFTISEVVSLAVAGAGVAIGGKAVFNIGNGIGITDVESGLSNAGAIVAGACMALVGLVLYGVFHLWELVDVWMRPAGRLSRRGRQGQATTGQSDRLVAGIRGAVAHSGGTGAILAF
jgi:hypothetical protein